MGTRGLFGLRKNNKDKTTYNHFDSYPSYLGEEMVEYVKNHSKEEMTALYDKLIMVDEEFNTSQFTEEQKERYKEFMKKNDFFSHTLDGAKTAENISMYCFLHEFQGRLYKYDEYPEIDLMIDNHNFIKNSLFCEWAYIINLDTNKLEVWEGFQEKPQENNRYGIEKDNGFYPCALVKEIDIEKIKLEDFSLEKALEGKHY
ncbi:hypothetical protein [Fusobacterium sp.]|uniref:hypothetical protein n=1 Tax=Fusobacterium sp. TaxID=68766 RepID=UPI002903C5E0|nr:hypothetical protein [Fusobacterium sp.]MDU1912528.1 hypothetical protein [Fusobacterium sp.]